MQNLMNVQDLTINSGNDIDSQRLLTMVNETRKEYGEPLIRNNKFIEKVIDELDGETYTKSVGQKNGADIEIIHMDKSRYSNKQVESFHYNEKALPKFNDIFVAEQEAAASEFV